MNRVIEILVSLMLFVSTSLTGPADGQLKPAVRLNPPVVVDQIDPPIPRTLSTPDLIRLVWPDNLENEALRIAYRESNYECCVKTYCCYGIFQINWIAHHGWLNEEFGLTSGYDLYDPYTNVVVAYRLYQKDGWTPWRCC